MHQKQTQKLLGYDQTNTSVRQYLHGAGYEAELADHGSGKHRAVERGSIQENHLRGSCQ